MSQGRPLVSFDWAIKRLLRQKANYKVLEGFLTVLLRREVKIISIPESSSNKTDAGDKSNAVDILCESEQKELILIELQYNSEMSYFHRMLFGTSKAITDHMFEGFDYEKVRKVYSINIVYFDLGQGGDYVYHGTTEFRGIHTHDLLLVNARQRALFDVEAPYELFPEYYIIKVNSFDDVAKDTLDEWIYYLKNHRLPEHYSAPGLKEAEKILNYYDMDSEAKALYDAHIKNRRISNDVLKSAKWEGREEGLKEGREEGLEKGLKEGREEGREEGLKEGLNAGKQLIVTNAFRQGIPVSTIALIADLSEEEVVQVLQKQGLLE